METDNSQVDIRQIKELLTDIRISLAKMETLQTERTRAYEQLDQKFLSLETEVSQLDKKVTYAAGAVAVVVSFATYIVNFILKKTGIS